MVVPLIGDQLLHPKKYFVQEMCMKEEATSQVSQFTVWYGIIEGEQKNEALSRPAVEASQTFYTFMEIANHATISSSCAESFCRI